MHAIELNILKKLSRMNTMCLRHPYKMSFMLKDIWVGRYNTFKEYGPEMYLEIFPPSSMGHPSFKVPSIPANNNTVKA
jgi:hypothetical protein